MLNLRINQHERNINFLGIFSFEKLLAIKDKIGLSPEKLQDLQEEHKAIQDLLDRFRLNSDDLRRSLRKNMGKGSFHHTQKVVHRDDDCKKAFETAAEMGMYSKKMSCLHLISAILEKPKDATEKTFRQFGANPLDLRNAALECIECRTEDTKPVRFDWEDLASVCAFTQKTGASVLTIMFDDIAGSTALCRNIGDEAFLSLIQKHDEILKRVFSKYQGIQIIKSTGDGALTIFTDAVTAIKSGLEIQHALLGDNVLKVRIGMEIGEVREDKIIKDVFGLAVSMASRITGAVKETGHVLISEAVYEKTMTELSQEAISSKFLGTCFFKPEEPVINIHEIYDSKITAPLPKFSLPDSDTPYLNQYGDDLTRKAREGRIHQVIGRRDETLLIIQTLARRSKNNPVLVGEPGVGKTAIVENLAIRAVQGKDPVLAGQRIVELNMGMLVSGTKYRGEFEERLTKILEELSSVPNIILFIDEIHTVVGAGSAGGSSDAANILKPALARGNLKCIGATTIAEYRRYIEKDAALERRFEKIIINEPSRDEALEILKGIKSEYEKHHNIRISNKALEAAVDLSIRFDSDHRLPDKAIDLLATAASKTELPMLSMGPDAARQPKIQGQDGSEVTENTIAQVLSEKINVPFEVIFGKTQTGESSQLLELEAKIKKELIGQDKAVEQVCQRLQMAYAGLGRRRGPLAVFIFLGPSGVGKTELARLLAAYLLGSESDMIRIDMSEYMEEHSVAKLIGSPPGYVGHEEEGQLTGKLRTKPHAVVLFDEVEKAHSRVFDLFLQLFDEGRLTDSKGRTVDAANAIFIMTSNISADKRAGFIYETLKLIASSGYSYDFGVRELRRGV